MPTFTSNHATMKKSTKSTFHEKNATVDTNTEVEPIETLKLTLSGHGLRTARKTKNEKERHFYRDVYPMICEIQSRCRKYGITMRAHFGFDVDFLEIL